MCGECETGWAVEGDTHGGGSSEVPIRSRRVTDTTRVSTTGTRVHHIREWGSRLRRGTGEDLGTQEKGTSSSPSPRCTSSTRHVHPSPSEQDLPLRPGMLLLLSLPLSLPLLGETTEGPQGV